MDVLWKWWAHILINLVSKLIWNIGFSVIWAGLIWVGCFSLFFGYSFLIYFFLMELCELGCWCVDGKHPGCDQSYFGRREFSFTLDNDIYLRFQSFNSASELENSIKEKCPVKIDIGPVYSVDVRMNFIFPNEFYFSFYPFCWSWVSYFLQL